MREPPWIHLRQTLLQSFRASKVGQAPHADVIPQPQSFSVESLLSMKKWKREAQPCLVAFLVLLTLTLAAQRNMDLDELSETLFPVDRQPFAAQDRWNLLNEAQREAWTSANDQIPSQSNFDDVLPLVNEAKRRRLSFLVTVKVVYPPDAIVNEDKVRRHAALMRATSNFTAIKFRILSAKADLYKAVKSVSDADSEKQISAILQHDASSSGIMDVLYIVVRTGSAAKQGPLSKLPEHPPILAGSRVSWIVHSMERSGHVNVAKMLQHAETAAQRMYAPSPSFFPIPISPVIRLSISAYTPGHEKEALWINSLSWKSFEKTVRKIALVGQTVGFFVNPSNKDCWNCEDLFQHVVKSDLVDVDRVLTWWRNAQKEFSAEGEVDVEEALEGDPSTMTNVHVLVVDTAKEKPCAVMNHLEKIGLETVQGAGLVMFNSNQPNFEARLQSLLIQAVAGSAFGIANADRYMVHDESLLLGPDAEPIGATLLLSDIALRHALVSSTFSKLNELDTILRTMEHFGVSPSKVLTSAEFTGVLQRTNLLLYKSKEAFSVLEEHRDDTRALHLAESGFHDIKAIRSAFHLQSPKKSTVWDHFRDPRSKCHFSKIHERAIELLEDQDSLVSRLGFFGVAFIFGFLLGHVAALIRGKVKRDEKRE